ncbi:MAG: hypothetical protein H7Z21_08210 [Hymenobacter sp.]|nr:hypothetical protein [Hymenobacter sp.]
MKPLNQPERRTRLWQFSLLYLLALLVPLSASYYLFSNSSIADENARLKLELDRTHEEQARMVTKFDTLTQHLRRIDGIDLRMMGESNPNVRSVLALKNQDYSNSIAANLSELRNDTALLQVPAHRLMARNVLRDFDLYRSTRNTIDALRGELARCGEGDKNTQRLLAEVANANGKVAAAEARVNQLNIALAAGGSRPPPPAREPGSRPNNSGEMALLRDKIAFAEADCQRQRALDLKPRSKERRQLLESSRTAFIQILQDPATDDLKQSIEKTLEPINLELGRPARFFGLL